MVLYISPPASVICQCLQYLIIYFICRKIKCQTFLKYEVHVCVSNWTDLPDKSAPNLFFPHILKTQPYSFSFKATLNSIGAMQVTYSESNWPAHTYPRQFFLTLSWLWCINSGVFCFFFSPWRWWFLISTPVTRSGHSQLTVYFYYITYYSAEAVLTRWNIGRISKQFPSKRWRISGLKLVRHISHRQDNQKWHKGMNEFKWWVTFVAVNRWW